ncbi:unnamed protein product [Phytophthora fragariaefolia]|uniref:Unnamed protein product n=1 Tax=Phytophthora fragariaefolia TaxID=1490495 RepID=A0A9W7CT24_9STRA|nr:unnamed protein product [Phytophthora fragariaefolia]
MVNSVTAIMEYAMPLVDDLLTDMEKYLWYCSLDAASGFWAVMMTQRARKISAFVCALGHFEWLRMPFGFKNAPIIYQRMIDNALRGFVQPRRGWSAFAERVRTAEAADTADGGSPTDTATHGRTRFTALQAKDADAPIQRHFDRDREVHVMLFANDWALSTTLMQGHDGVMHSVRFCGRVLKDNGVNYHPAEKEVLALLLLLKTCYTQLAGRTIHACTRFSTLGWINTSKTLFGRSTEFAVILSQWHLVVHRVTEDDSAFAQLLHPTITNFVGLDKALQRVAPPSKRTPMVRMDPVLLYARIPNDHRGFVLSFDGSAKTPKHGGYGSCAWILWLLPDWKIEIAAGAYLESTTLNQADRRWCLETRNPAIARGDRMPEGVAFDSAEHTPMARCEISIRQIPPRHPRYNASADSLAGETLAAKEAKTILTEESKSKLEQLNRIHEVIYERPNREVTLVSTLRTLSGDMGTQRDNIFDFALKPRFITAITRQQTLPAKKRVRFADTHDEDSEALPVEPEPPERPNDVTTEPSHVENGETSPGAAERPPSAEDVDPLEVQEERRRRVCRAQDEELHWAKLKFVLKGESSSLGYKTAREAWKMADRFVLSDDGLLYFLGENRRWGNDRMNETVFRLVVPTTMVQEVSWINECALFPVRKQRPLCP